MSGPGKGRYTDFVGIPIPGPTSKYSRLHKLFNSSPMTDQKGLLYGSTSKSNQSDNSSAAASISETFVSTLKTDGVLIQTEDKSKPRYFVGTSAVPLPDTSAIKFIDPAKSVAGDPSNAFMPDLASPGASGVSASIVVNFERASSTLQDAKAYKPNITISSTSIDSKNRQNLGTVSPSLSSPLVGATSVDSQIELGSSKKS
jgi:hypothetical protein